MWLSLIDFQRNCSRPPSGLMKPSGICHPSTPPARPRQPAPPLHLPPLSTLQSRPAPNWRPARAGSPARSLFGWFCLVAFPLYPQTKRRRSSARRAGIHLGLVWGPPDKPRDGACACRDRSRSRAGRRKRFLSLKATVFRAASIKSACKTLKRESESKFLHPRLELRFMFPDSSNLSTVSRFFNLSKCYQAINGFPERFLT